MAIRAEQSMISPMRSREKWAFPVRWSQMTRDYFRATGEKLAANSVRQ